MGICCASVSVFECCLFIHLCSFFSLLLNCVGGCGLGWVMYLLSSGLLGCFSGDWPALVGCLGCLVLLGVGQGPCGGLDRARTHLALVPALYSCLGGLHTMAVGALSRAFLCISGWMHGCPCVWISFLCISVSFPFLFLCSPSSLVPPSGLALIYIKYLTKINE